MRHVVKRVGEREVVNVHSEQYCESVAEVLVSPPDPQDATLSAGLGTTREVRTLHGY